MSGCQRAGLHDRDQPSDNLAFLLLWEVAAAALLQGPCGHWDASAWRSTARPCLPVDHLVCLVDRAYCLRERLRVRFSLFCASES